MNQITGTAARTITGIAALARNVIANKQHIASQQPQLYEGLVSQVVAGAPSNLLTEIFIIFFQKFKFVDSNGQ